MQQKILLMPVLCLQWFHQPSTIPVLSPWTWKWGLGYHLVCAHNKRKADSFGPCNPAPVVLPAGKKMPGTPVPTDDNSDTGSVAGIGEGTNVQDCNRPGKGASKD